MPPLVVQGAVLTCSAGTAPSSLTPSHRPVLAAGRPAATVMDHLPLAHVAPFGLCTSPVNPAVAAATAAAAGVLTPQPCVPFTPVAWSGASGGATAQGQPLLTASCTLACTWNGTVTVVNPGQAQVSVEP